MADVPIFDESQTNQPSASGPTPIGYASGDSSSGSFFDDAISALIKPARRFGTIAAQIVISERHTDRAEKTSHPVEVGANISDHIKLLPTQVVVRMGWTNYGLQSPGTYIKEAASGGPIPTPNSISQIYSAIRGIMTQRVPFKLVTGKRMLPTMVLLDIVEETDERTENSLILTCLCEEIFLVQTHVVAVPPNSAHVNPEASASPVDMGTKQLAVAGSPLNTSPSTDVANIQEINKGLGMAAPDPSAPPDLTPGTPDYVAAVMNGSITLPTPSFANLDSQGHLLP